MCCPLRLSTLSPKLIIKSVLHGTVIPELWSPSQLRDITLQLTFGDWGMCVNNLNGVVTSNETATSQTCRLLYFIFQVCWLNCYTSTQYSDTCCKLLLSFIVLYGYVGVCVCVPLVRLTYHWYVAVRLTCQHTGGMLKLTNACLLVSSNMVCNDELMLWCLYSMKFVKLLYIEYLYMA